MEEQTVRQIEEFLRKEIDPAFIIIFGSFAKGSVHKDSDLDIAFYSEEREFSSYDLFMMAQELADMLKLEVDLVNLRTASTVFQAQIYTTGKVIYSKDESLRKRCEMLSLRMYVKLNEERKDIILKVNESGTIYDK
ncbi:nucleotidyltransferase domain-containing protein [Bacillus sp. FJAT-42376]|uniref:type VII toxin-antitoxin system MntA family adenylyltransferase antitoxin n=1 Tax=Bacillus sp. FJAT-42376 TaxID=2014076 RepID=UPI000F507F5B|nr:nucleotidyltransferase domain-containing protein [Bacillus sp. FJAT-42376]AZB42050.1 nucleotidyltransferase domain-containing protein [Bacillus sp. FJAT-42376]